MKKSEEIISMCKQFFGKWSAFALVFGFSAIITSEALSAVLWYDDPSEESPKFYKLTYGISYSSSERTCVDGTGRIKYFDNQGRVVQEETYSNCDDSTNEYSGKTKEIRTNYNSYAVAQNRGRVIPSYEYACEDGKCALSSASTTYEYNLPYEGFKAIYSCDPETYNCVHTGFSENSCNEHIKNDSGGTYNCTIYSYNSQNRSGIATEVIKATKLDDGSYKNEIYKCDNSGSCSLDKTISSNGESDEWIEESLPVVEYPNIYIAPMMALFGNTFSASQELTAQRLNSINHCSKYDKWGDCVECGDSNVLVTDVGVCTDPGRCRGEHFINPETGNCDRKEGCSDFANGACICDSEYYTKDGACVLATEGCGDYYKKGNSCVSDCGGDSLEKNGVCISASLGCGEGYKDMGGYCNRVRYSPAEAAAIVGDSNTNIVTLTFKK